MRLTCPKCLKPMTVVSKDMTSTLQTEQSYSSKVYSVCNHCGTTAKTHYETEIMSEPFPGEPIKTNPEPQQNLFP